MTSISIAFVATGYSYLSESCMIIVVTMTTEWDIHLPVYVQ